MLALAALLASLSLSTPAQTDAPFTARTFPQFLGGLPDDLVSAERSYAVGDLDGSGRPSVVFAGSDLLAVALNVGDSRFETIELDATALAETFGAELRLGDVDADGILDLLAVVIPIPGVSGGGFQLFLGDGAGGFSPTAFRPNFSELFPSDAELADLTGDGLPEVLVGISGRIESYRNLGGGNFSANAIVLFQGSLAANWEFGATDDGFDGDLDLIVTAPAGEGFLLENQGAGVFTKVGSLPSGSEPLLADLNGSGTEELVIIVPGALGTGWVDAQVYTKLPGGGAALTQTLTLPGSASVGTFGDLDGDGNLDLLGGTSWVRGLGNGMFDSASAADIFEQGAGTSSGPFRLVAADFDLDGDTDVIARAPLLGQFSARLFLNRGDATLEEWAKPDAHRFDLRNSLVDVDADGDIDVVQFASAAPTGSPPRYQLLRNDGQGGFEAEVQAGYVSPSDPHDVAFGDLDGNGTLDAYLALGRPPGSTLLGPTPNALRLGDGTGGFAIAACGPFCPADLTNAAVLVDADADGDLDVFLANTAPDSPGGANRLLLNDGLAGFSDGNALLPSERGYSSAAAALDYDLDGDADLLVANQTASVVGGGVGSQPLLFSNEGAGGFSDQTAAALPSGDLEVEQLLTADVDGDGDTDAFFAAQPGLFVSAGDLLLINVSGTFLPGMFPPNFEAEPFNEFYDADFDGDLDLLRLDFDTLDWFENLGGIQFAARAPYHQLQGKPDGDAVRAGDLDGDGDMDLMLGTAIERSLVREVWASSPASVGKELTLELRSTAPATPWLTAFSTGLVEVPLPPLGTLRLDLSVPSGVIGSGVLDADGEARSIVPIPASASLVGVEVHVQALLGAPAMLSRAVTLELDAL